MGKVKLSPQAGKRITLLVDQVQAAQTEYQLSADAPAGDEEIQRGRFVVSELTVALELLLDDGVEDERDAQLARVRQANEDQSSTDALAGALAEYAGPAEAYRDELGPGPQHDRQAGLGLPRAAQPPRRAAGPRGRPRAQGGKVRVPASPADPAGGYEHVRATGSCGATAGGGEGGGDGGRGTEK